MSFKNVWRKPVIIILFIIMTGLSFMIFGENKTDNNRSLVEFIDKGIMKASWYGPGFHGRKTANGEIYDQSLFTAAHKSIKFGTILKITNIKNQRAVIVRVNDRGPYIKGRQLDVSKAVAYELDFVHTGVTKLKVEELKLASKDNEKTGGIE